VSAGAISWALNLAPVPADWGGQPFSACKFVLVGLATPHPGHRPEPRQPAQQLTCPAARVGNSTSESNPPTGSSAATTLRSNS
jgi:hypothetical protein